MYLSLKEELLNQLKEQAKVANGGELWGVLLDDQTVGHIQALEPVNEYQLIGSWLKAGQPYPAAHSVGNLLLVVEPTSGSLEGYAVSPELTWQLQDIQKVSTAEFESRLTGIFSPRALFGKKVVIVGLGSGGSAIAFELARAGVSDFILIDYDRLETSNISRHICGLNDIGRYKTLAVSDYLYNSNPKIKVETHEFDITKDLARLNTLIIGADLVVGATDSEHAKSLINEIAWHNSIAVVYGAAYDLGTGGDIFLAEPKEGACYQCFRLSTEEIFAAPHDAEGIEDYGMLVDGKPISQPAVGIDVRMVGLITARVALAWLLRDDAESSIKPFPSNWILWGNQVRPGWLFDRPLQSEYIQIEKLADCPVCNQEEYIQRNLGLSVAEASEQSQDIRQNIPVFDSLKQN